MFKFATVFLCLGAVFASDVDTYNALVDESLYLAQQMMVEYKYDTLPLPPVTRFYQNDDLSPSWTGVSGTFSTGSGTLVNATGLNRDGDANITMVDHDKMIINFGISTDSMEMTLNELNINFTSPLSLKYNSGMKLNFGQNKASLQITIQKDASACAMTIDSAEVTSLGSVGVVMLPDTWWAMFKDKGIDFYLSAHKDDMRIVINKYLQEAFQYALDNINLCQYLPF